jgi:hypothetical protein
MALREVPGVERRDPQSGQFDTDPGSRITLHPDKTRFIESVPRQAARIRAAKNRRSTFSFPARDSLVPERSCYQRPDKQVEVYYEGRRGSFHTLVSDRGSRTSILLRQSKVTVPFIGLQKVVSSCIRYAIATFLAAARCSYATEPRLTPSFAVQIGGQSPDT